MPFIHVSHSKTRDIDDVLERVNRNLDSIVGRPNHETGVEIEKALTQLRERPGEIGVVNDIGYVASLASNVDVFIRKHADCERCGRFTACIALNRRHPVTKASFDMQSGDVHVCWVCITQLFDIALR